MAREKEAADAETPSRYGVLVVPEKPAAAGDGWGFDVVSYYIYSSEGLRELLVCTDMSSPVLLPEGEYDIVATANSQGELDTSVICRYDVMELLTCRLDAEEPGSPMCSGELHLSIKKDTTARIGLVPMLSRVNLVQIENNMGGLTRMESPRVHLTQVNSQAEMLRHSGFRPVEVIRDGDITYIDDVGSYPSYPDASLYCYPNEDTGSRATGIVLDCTIDGTARKMSARLPAIGRNCVIYASLRVDGPEDYSWDFRTP